MNNGELLKIQTSLGYVATKETGAWYQISRNVQRVTPFLEAIEQSKKTMLDKLASKDSKGKFKVKDGHYVMGGNQKEFNTLYQELMAEEIEIEFYTFPYDKFGDCKLDAMKIEPLMDIIIVDGRD